MAGAVERAFIAPPIATGGNKVIASPFQFYTTGEDNLRLTSYTELAGQHLRLAARLIDSKGTISAAVWDHMMAATFYTARSEDFPLAPGAVLNVSITAVTPTNVGQTFVILQLVRGLGPAAIVLGTILQGYVTQNQALAWPGSPIQTSTDADGIHAEATTQPTFIGADYTILWPATVRLQQMTLTATLATSAVAGARRVFMNYTIGGRATWYSELPFTVPPAAVQIFTFAQGYAGAVSVAGQIQMAPLPVNHWNNGGGAITLGCVGMDAADEWRNIASATRYLIEAK